MFPTRVRRTVIRRPVPTAMRGSCCAAGIRRKMFVGLCEVDLALDQFENFRVAQTSVARLSGMVIRNRIAGTLAFSLLADERSAQYVWDRLLDAMTEFAGTVSGAGVMVEDFDER